jgi:hypothetical protein
MASGSNKMAFLIIGVMLGFFVGGGIIWWQLSKKNFHNSSQQNTTDSTLASKKIHAQKLAFKKKYKEELIKYKIPDTFIDTLKMDSTTLTLEELIALYSKENANNSGEDIVVSKDEKLFSKLLKISGEYYSSEDDYEMDSVLTEQRHSQKKPAKSILVEFWKSPINYKGYKMDDYSLVVFGLLEYDNLSLKATKGNLYIKYKNDYFPVELTDDFKPLNLLQDHAIAQELNKL